MSNTRFFEGVKGNFGFGCMRLPMTGGEVDIGEFTRMIDAYLESGFNYFDTAHVYLDGKSETALRTCLTSRYPRDRFFFVDKLSGSRFQSNGEIRPLFRRQLDACGLEYFDLYLMHAQGKQSFAKFKECRAYETALQLRDEGKIKHLGISFHDKAVVLEQILSEYPQIEAVQIQFNYADYENPAVESRKCYEVCRKFQKPVIVMEPVKGGSLVKLPAEAQHILDQLHGGSNASYAIRFAAGFDGIEMVLSGMGSMAMMEDNLHYMRNFKPLDSVELDAIHKVCAILEEQIAVPCTDCRYCVEHCPQHIPIPALFDCLNNKRQFQNSSTDGYYNSLVASKGKASDCIRCGKCESACPQHLNIRTWLTEVAKEFEGKNAVKTDRP